MPIVVDAEAPGDERGALLAYLEAQRGGVRRALHGLTEEQARSVPSASAMSLSALLKHLALTERSWLRTFRGHRRDFTAATKEWESGWRPTEEETVDVLLALYDEVAGETEEAVRAQQSLDDTFEHPRMPWHPGGTYTWRWGLLHLIEEAARHAGHADIIRESIDGKGAFDLVFETGAMPEPDWSAWS